MELGLDSRTEGGTDEEASGGKTTFYCGENYILDYPTYIQAANYIALWLELHFTSPYYIKKLETSSGSTVVRTT